MGMQCRSRSFVFCVVIIVSSYMLQACNTGTKTNASESAAVTKNQPTINPLDSLEKMFDNDNWMSIDKKDTSYYYFSRTEPGSLKVFHYSMLHGDSVSTVLTVMKLSNAALTWQMEGRKLTLDSTRKNICKWIDLPGKEAITFRKKSDKEIEVTSGGKQVMKLQKTVTLSSFLTRSRYDHIHNTRLAFNDSVKIEQLK